MLSQAAFNILKRNDSSCFYAAYTEPGLKGDTATNTLKPATVESGATVRVPLFINEGETIEIDTRDGSYVSRVKA